MAGKLAEGPAPGPATMYWGTANSKQSRKSIQDLFRATPGSAGLDLSSSAYTVLTPEMGMQALPTGVHGPLPKGTMGLLLGRSSTTMKGLLVSPGVIDNDYEGEIKIMAHSQKGITVIEKGQRIAQLVLIPMANIGNKSQKAKRDNAGFGSSDVYWVQAIGSNRPTLTLNIEGRRFQGLLDTGADVSVLATEQWPDTWPKQPTGTQLQGIGQTQSPNQSSDLLSWKDDEGHVGTFQPYIVPGLPVNLWGRDVMKQMGAFLYSPSEIVTQQMFDQGMLPNQGLGPKGQGRQDPIMPIQRPPRTGLGYF